MSLRAKGLSISDLCRLYRYDAETGAVYWLPRAAGARFGTYVTPKRTATWFNRYYSGKRAETLHPKGYLMLQGLGFKLLAHRAAWAMYHGVWPAEHLDHVNGVRDDNRIANLREVSSAENQRNMKRSKANTSGHTGVHWDKRRALWAASIQAGGRSKCLGRYACLDAAVAARKEAEKLYGFHPNHGRSA